MDFSDGASWLRVDLHLHSPHAETFRLPDGSNLNNAKDRPKIIQAYIQQLQAHNIKIGAITDYQQIRKDWFLSLQDAARQADIFIFPGVELSINFGRKIHILVIFDLDQDLDAVNRFIQSCDDSAEHAILTDRTHRELNAKTPPVGMLKSLRQHFQCLIIFAHPEDEQGLIKEFQPKQAAELLKLADGIEFISERGKERVLSTNLISRDFFSRIAMLENSDPKSIMEIGTKLRNGNLRQTFFKLSSISLDALKIALYDPELRIRLYQKPAFYYDKIKSIDINGSFLRQIHLDFNAEMTTLIGGRGVGKSAMIETLRYGLNLPIYAESSFRTDFVTNIVGSGGEIKINIERYFGQQKRNFVVRRIMGQIPEVYRDDQVEKYRYEPGEIFEAKMAPIILGQKELYALSLDKAFQLKLIDDFIGQKIQRETLEFDKLIHNLKENATRILEIEQKLRQKEDYEQRLQTLNSHIKTFESLGVVEKLKRFTDLFEDEKILSTAYELILRLQTEFKDKLETTQHEFGNLFAVLLTAKSENKEIITEATLSFLVELLEKVTTHQESIAAIFTEYQIKLEKTQQAWLERKKPIESEVIQIKKQLQREGLSPEKYESLIKEKITIAPIINELERMSRNLMQLEQAREQIKQNLRQKRYEIYNIRKEMLAELNQKLMGRLQIEVQFEKNQKEFKEKFLEMSRGSNIRVEAIESICNSDDKTIDGLQLSEFIKKDASIFAAEFNLTETMVARFSNWFSDKSRRFELETCFPDDRIIIKLKIGDEFKPLDKLSAGQKATALLLLLFAQEHRILVIDQPEEDLDNRFIYEDVVKILREMKEKRQIIMATHNANIPVLGDSELIAVLEATHEICRIQDTGSIDQLSIRENVKNILEGGEEAFLLRAKKYGSIENG